uniref:Expansin-like EG45 domain-containing protein n=1 Tax=Triticum urartu TaxID=4572 RepID=A0A8R7PYT1_TRIUA
MTAAAAPGFFLLHSALPPPLHLSLLPHTPRPITPTPVPATPSPGSGSTNVDAGGWLDARATWYGAPDGAGPLDNGGPCGFKNVNLPPFNAMTSCGNEPIFKDGKGCGSCYQIRCVGKAHPACSGVRPQDGDHHGHELLPCRPLPLRRQPHCLRRHGQGRSQRRAPPRRHHQHAVQEGVVPVPRVIGDVPRGEEVEP